MGVYSLIITRYPQVQNGNPILPLSEFEAKKAKAGEKPYKMFDGGGLYLHVMPTGSKLWKQKYRFNKKEKVLSFGKYPTVGISQARKLRDDPSESQGRLF